MRPAPVVALFAAALLSACATAPNEPASRHEFQPGPLKVNPGLYGKGARVKTAPQLTAQPPVAATPAAAPAASPAAATAPMAAAPAAPAPAARAADVGADTATLAASKDLKAHLRSERSFYFDLNKADLKPDYDPVLKAHASYLAQNPSARVRIEGHADERGGREHNRMLGQRRAETVRADLIERGAPERQIGIKSYGELKPRLKGHDEESWAENRRADVVYEAE